MFRRLHRYWSQNSRNRPHIYRWRLQHCKKLREWNSASYDTVLRRLTSRSKETKEKMDTFCKTETCWMGPIEELGYMLEAF